MDYMIENSKNEGINFYINNELTEKDIVKIKTYIYLFEKYPAINKKERKLEIDFVKEMKEWVSNYE